MSQLSTPSFCDTDIKELIYQYKQYDCLWNIHSPNYNNKSLKKRAWLELAQFFQKEVSEIKRKVQYLCTAYAHEKSKVDMTRKSGVKRYKPSLFYYKELNFLDNMVNCRKFETDSRIESVEISQDTVDNEFISFDNNEDEFLKEPEINSKPEMLIVNTSKVSHPPQSRPGKRKISAKVDPNRSSSGNDSPHFSANSQTKILDVSFGKSIALQLQQLPPELAILAMSEIQTILTEKTLQHINNLQKGTESSNFINEHNISELIEDAFNDSS